MMDYNLALANAKNVDEQDAELVHNVEILANNFGVLNRYIQALLVGHLDLLKQNPSKRLGEKSINSINKPF